MRKQGFRVVVSQAPYGVTLTIGPTRNCNMIGFEKSPAEENYVIN